MKHIRYLYRKQLSKSIHGLLLVCSIWLAGLLLGRYLASSAEAAQIDILLYSGTVSPNPAIMMAAQMIPLVLTYFAARLPHSAALYGIILCHGVFFGFPAHLSILAFRSAGWLVYRILFFSQRINAFLLLWTWANIQINRCFLSAKVLYLLAGIISLVTLFDYFICSGFLISVLT